MIFEDRSVDPDRVARSLQERLTQTPETDPQRFLLEGLLLRSRALWGSEGESLYTAGTLGDVAYFKGTLKPSTKLTADKREARGPIEQLRAKWNLLDSLCFYEPTKRQAKKEEPKKKTLAEKIRDLPPFTIRPSLRQGPAHEFVRDTSLFGDVRIRCQRCRKQLVWPREILMDLPPYLTTMEGLTREFGRCQLRQAHEPIVEEMNDLQTLEEIYGGFRRGPPRYEVRGHCRRCKRSFRTEVNRIRRTERTPWDYELDPEDIEELGECDSWSDRFL